MSDIHGMVWWSELMTRDIEAARAYYEKVAGWTCEIMPQSEHTYYICKKDDKPVAGLMDMTNMEHLTGIPSHWFTYVSVDNLDSAVSQTQVEGGKLRREAWDIPGIGRIAIVEDPSGAPFGLIQPSQN